MTREETINLISERIKHFSLAEAWLFGSSARGDYKDDSDIDLLILLPDDMSSDKRINYQQQIVEKLWDIEMESGYDISPVILQYKIWNQRKTPFTCNVTHDRIRI